MAVPGREPSATSVNRNAPTVDWTEVENLPYTGKKPALPAHRTHQTPEGPTPFPYDKATVDWWTDVSSMPHCSTWAPTDWRFALQTALLVDILHYGKHAVATEIRNRENAMGTTAEARRKMRIRYIDPIVVAPKTRTPTAKKAAQANVTQIDERRKRAIDAS